MLLIFYSGALVLFIQQWDLDFHLFVPAVRIHFDQKRHFIDANSICKSNNPNKNNCASVISSCHIKADNMS